MKLTTPSQMMHILLPLFVKSAMSLLKLSLFMLLNIAHIVVEVVPDPKGGGTGGGGPESLSESQLSNKLNLVIDTQNVLGQ